MFAELFESEESNAMYESYQPIYEQADEALSNFKSYLKAFILKNPEHFMAETAQETFNRIAVFTEAATCQYLGEVSAICEHAIASIEMESIQETEEKKTILSKYM